MKLGQLIIKNDIIEDTKEAIISSSINYNKIYELLHKQLYRKGRIVYLDYQLTINNRPAKLIQQYNIKSPSKDAYSSTDYYDLGLNQFFVGQSPYQEYTGDPKDGIYHDKCYIAPKILEDNKASEYLTEYDIFGWNVVVNFDEGENVTTLINTSVNEYDRYSNHLIDDVKLVNVGGIYYINSYLNNVIVNNIYTFPIDTDIVFYGIFIQKVKLSNPQYCPRRAVFNLSSFGEIIYREQGVGSFFDGQILNLLTGYKDVYYAYSHPEYVELTGYDSEVIVFNDGTAVQITYPSIASDSSDGVSYYHVSATIAFLPLMYIDTGDLAQNKWDFVDNWENQFRLIVKEDRDTFTRFFMVAAFTVAGFFTGGVGYFALFGGLGGFLGGVGTINNNSYLKLAGGLLGLTATVAGSVQNEIVKNYTEIGLSEEAAQTVANDMLLDMSASDLFLAYTNSIGFGKVLNAGNTLFSAYTTLVGTQTVSQNTEETKEERTIGIIEDEKSSGHSYINKIMNIGKIDIK